MCNTQNLITEPNSPFNKIPVYDQDGSGDCYAYTAAQLMDYYLIKNGRRDRSIHPLWASTANAFHENRDSLFGGHSSKVIKAINQIGNCPFSTATAGIAAWMKKDGIKESEVLNIVELFSHNMQQKMKKGPPTKEGARQAMAAALFTHDLTCDPGLFTEINQLFGGDPRSNQTRFSTRNLASWILMPGCHDKIDTSLQLPQPRIFFESLKSDEAYSRRLKELLNNEQKPVSIAICSTVLTSPGYVGAGSDELGRRYINDEKVCGGHDTLIVGKKEIGKECHFLLRNSWGNGWSNWNQKRKCVCKNTLTGAFVEDCTFKTHPGPNISVEGCYVSETDVKQNAAMLTVL